MHTTTATNAILLVAVGFLGVIAANLTGTRSALAAGFAAFVLAIVAGVGALFGAIREGFNAPRETPRSAPADPAKRKRTADPYANVPY